MKRKLIKRISIFALLIAMLVTMANPVSIYAEEPATDDKMTEAGDNTETNQDLDEEKETQESGGTTGTEKAGNGQYDTTKPVIEKVEFPQQGTTVKADETIRLYVYAYDTGTEEGKLSVEARISADGDTVYMNTSYDIEKGCYVCEYTLSNTSAEKISISSIEVTDKASNYINYSCYENGEYKYWVSVEQQTSEEVHIKKFEFKQNGQTLDENGMLEMTLETEEELEGYRIYASFQCKNASYTSTREFSFYSVNTENKKEFKSNNTVGIYYGDGTWTLQSIYIKKGSIGKAEYLNIDSIGECKYIVKKTVSNVTKPVITSVSLDRNGETLSAGDSVNITIEAVSDEGKLDERGYVYFRAISDIANSSKTAYVYYDEEKAVYEGVFEVTEDTYPCEWYVNSIQISDTENNSADYSAFTYNANYPYYIQVTNGNTFVNPTYDINISFSALNENGEWETIQKYQKEKVERRQTLKEIGITFPEMQSKYPGFTQTGWTDYNGNPITEDTQVVGNSSYMSIRAKYDKTLVSANYKYRKADGNISYQTQKVEVPEGMTCKELRKMVESAEAPEESYQGMSFQKWEMEMPYGCTDESPFNTDYVRIDAVYDKNSITVEYTYVDTESNWSKKTLPLLFEKGETYGSVIKKAKEYLPEDITKEYRLEQWENTSYNNNIMEDDEIAADYLSIKLRAKFSGKILLEVGYINSFNQRGNNYAKRAVFVDEGTTGKDVIKTLKEEKLPEFYPGLVFKEWKITGIGDNAVATQGQRINMEAVYENCLVCYIIDPVFALPAWDGDEYYEYETIICQVVEKGETVTFRESFDGYEKVVWNNRPDDTFTVEECMTFCGYGTKASEEPDQPTPPSQPENPSQPDNPSIPSPGVTLPQETIDNTIKIIKSAESGGSVSIDMDGATVISQEILEAAKGKDVDVQLNMGGYTWTINGKDIKAGNLKDINLEVILDTKNIPSKTLQALAGDNPIRQLSLAHEGDFGFKASLTVNVGSKHSGQFGNLYYHDSDGKMVFINAGKINPDGNVSLEFSHASDYVIVMSDKEMSQSDVPAEISPTQKKEQVVSPKKSAKTGDETNIVYWMVLGMIALGVCGIFGRKKFYRG